METVLGYFLSSGPMGGADLQVLDLSCIGKLGETDPTLSCLCVLKAKPVSHKTWCSRR